MNPPSCRVRNGSHKHARFWKGSTRKTTWGPSLFLFSEEHMTLRRILSWKSIFFVKSCKIKAAQSLRTIRKSSSKSEILRNVSPVITRFARHFWTSEEVSRQLMHSSNAMPMFQTSGIVWKWEELSALTFQLSSKSSLISEKHFNVAEPVLRIGALLKRSNDAVFFWMLNCQFLYKCFGRVFGWENRVASQLGLKSIRQTRSTSTWSLSVTTKRARGTTLVPLSTHRIVGAVLVH